MIHFLIQYSYLSDYGIKFESEVAIKGLYNKYLISGTGDIVVELQNSKKYLIDIKSMRSNLFNKLHTLDDVSSLYIGQTALYTLGLGLENGGILFWNKDTGELKEFFFSRNHERAKPILKKALSNALVAKNYLFGKKNIPILDECKQHKGKFKSCPYSSVCFSCRNIDSITTNSLKILRKNSMKKKVLVKSKSKLKPKKKVVVKKKIQEKEKVQVKSKSEQKLRWDKVLKSEQIKELEIFRKVIEETIDVMKPDKKLEDYINKLETLADASDRVLEIYLAIITAWHNYYARQLKLSEVIKTVADEQRKMFYSIAIRNLKGTITEKKQLAFSDELYLEALDVYYIAKAIYDSVQSNFDLCDRSYKAVSRIVKIREMEK
jgi:predicted regulator of amino acid metabolism with ACT domain